MRKSQVILGAVGVLLAFGNCFPFAEAQGSETSGYSIVRTIPIAGEGSWDYLSIDPARRRLFVTHATHVVVLDVDTGKVVGDIPDTSGVHGVVIAPVDGRGFTSNGTANTATIFDLQSLKKIDTVPTGASPDGILYDPATRRVFTFNHGSKDVTAINAADGTIAGTIPLGDRPEFAVADGKGSIFVNIPDKAIVREYSASTLSFRRAWTVPCSQPSPLAMDTVGRRLFEACEDKKMAVLDADTGTVLSIIDIGGHVDAAAYDSGTKLAFSSNGEGTLSIIHNGVGNDIKLIETLPTKFGARTMAIDPKTHTIFLAAADFDPAIAGGTRPRMKPNTLVILVLERK
jgi:DNA-binding beta-propeller fold protein YncE